MPASPRPLTHRPRPAGTRHLRPGEHNPVRNSTGNRPVLGPGRRRPVRHRGPVYVPDESAAASPGDDDQDDAYERDGDLSRPRGAGPVPEASATGTVGSGRTPETRPAPRTHTARSSPTLSSPRPPGGRVRCTLRPMAITGLPRQRYPGRRRPAGRSGPERMPVDPDGQHEQAAAQLGGMARARYGEGAVGGVPLPLCSDQVVGEGEAVHAFIRSHVRIMVPLTRSAWGSLRSVSCATEHPTPSRSVRRARRRPGAAPVVTGGCESPGPCRAGLPAPGARGDRTGPGAADPPRSAAGRTCGGGCRPLASGAATAHRPGPDCPH